MVQIGIRGAQNFDEGWRYCEEMGFTVIWCEDVHREGVDAAVARAREIVGDAPTYVSPSVVRHVYFGFAKCVLKTGAFGAFLPPPLFAQVHKL